MIYFYHGLKSLLLLSPQRLKAGSISSPVGSAEAVTFNAGLGYRSDEIREHPVGSRVKARIFLGDGEAGEDVSLEIDV